MRRTFAEHLLRPVASLDGLWALRPHDGSGKTYSAMVPGVWEHIPALASYRGTADYERTVEIAEHGNYLLRMGAVSHTGHVYWDEQLVGQHYNAFTGFDILLKNVAAGPHDLRVLVDNRFTEESTLHIPNDYYTYGGINRAVELHKVGKAYIERMAFHSVKTGEHAYQAIVKVFVRAIEDVADAKLQLSVAGSTAETGTFALTAGENREIELTADVQGVQEWDVFTPNLYDLTAIMTIGNAAADDMIDHVGFRTVEVVGERIHLNGKPVYLKGFNRHEDHACSAARCPRKP